MEKDRLSNLISNMRYLIDCLESLRIIHELPCCNDCGKVKECEYVPKPGQIVRYNCPFHEKENKNG